jgi:mevalonate kinase
LITVNNNLLRTIDVSHPKLEKILTIAANNEFAAKITGAGGGGCVFVLLPSNFKSLAKYKSLCDSFTSAGFNWMQTSVSSGTGVDFKFSEKVNKVL